MVKIQNTVLYFVFWVLLSILYFGQHDQKYFEINFVGQSGKAVGKIYRQLPHEIYVDSRLVTFFHWPPELPYNRTRLHSYAKRFPLNSEVFVISKESQNERSDCLQIEEIYSFKDVTFVKKIQTICDGPTTSCMYFLQHSKRRADLHGAPLVLATTVKDSMKNKLKNDQCDVSITANCSESDINIVATNQILFMIKKMLNVSLIFKTETDHITQETQPGGSVVLGGTGRLLQNGEADIVFPAEFILDYRLEHLTASLPIGAEPVMAYFIQPKPSSVRNIYSLPFSRKTWIAFVTLTVGFIISSFIFAKIGPGIPTERKWWSSQNIFWIISAYCQKEWYYTPVAVSGKILVGVVNIMSLILFSMYSSAMISGLTNEPVAVTHLTHLGSNNFKLLFDPKIFHSFFHISADDGMHWLNHIFKPHQLKQNYINDSDAVEQVMKSKVAFLTSTRNFISAYYTVHHNDTHICETFSKIGFTKRFLRSSIFLQKGTPIKELLNYKLTLLFERGLKFRFWNVYSQRNNSAKCPQNRFTYRENLAFSDVSTAFFFLYTIGFLGAFIAFTIERKVYKFRKMIIQKYYRSDHIIF